MITRIRFVNFRSHPDSTLELKPINLIVGPTAAGKSNLFKGLVLLQGSLHRSLGELFPPGTAEFHWVRSRWAGETDPISFEVDLDELDGFPETQARYKLSIADAPDGLYVVSETLERRSTGQAWEWVFQRRKLPKLMGEFGQVDPYGPTILYRALRGQVVNAEAPNVVFAKEVARSLSTIAYYHLEVSKLRELGTGRPSNRIGYYGEGLPDFIAWSKSNPDDTGVYEAIQAKMQELLPNLEEIHVTQVGPDRQGLAATFKGHNGYITARDLSDGTLFTLGLLSVTLGAKPRLLCIEEPETGLHPRRLRWLFEQLVDLAYPKGEGKRRVQVLLTTHSPDLVDLFTPMLDSVFVVDLVAGKSRVRPLKEILAQLKEPEQRVSIGHAWATGLYEGL